MYPAISMGLKPRVLQWYGRVRGVWVSSQKTCNTFPQEKKSKVSFWGRNFITMKLPNDVTYLSIYIYIHIRVNMYILYIYVYYQYYQCVFSQKNVPICIFYYQYVYYHADSHFFFHHQIGESPLPFTHPAEPREALALDLDQVTSKVKAVAGFSDQHLWETKSTDSQIHEILFCFFGRLLSMGDFVASFFAYFFLKIVDVFWVFKKWY